MTVKSVVSQLPALLKDLAALRNPALAATILAELVQLISPFGINVGPDGPIITGALVLIGTIAGLVQRAIAAQAKPAAK